MPLVSVIEQFLAPPLEVLSREIVPGIYTGQGSLTRPRGPIPVDAFGISFEFVTIPAGFGYQLGNVLTYTEVMLQLSIIRTMLDGHDVVAENTSYFSDNLPVLFDKALPTEVQYYIAPGVYVQFFWLVVFV